MYVAMGVATVTSSQLNANDASRLAIQTLQYADIKANELRATAYSTIATKAEARTPIPSTKFDREVLIGAETDLGGGSKQRIVTVNIYKTGEIKPRQAIDVPLSSLGSGAVPSGTILPWYGNISAIPSGFAYCDGTNGTPDLRGRTLVGTGSWSDSYGTINYTLGQYGGERAHKLTIAEMPIHHLEISIRANNGATNSGWNDVMKLPNGVGNTIIPTSDIGGDQPHNIMQPYMAVHWIIKV